MLGLDHSGKTSILLWLKFGKPMNCGGYGVGFNVETIQHRRCKLTIWDVSGQDRVRALWPHYYERMQALIYVVDSHNRQRLEEAADCLHRVASDERLRDIPVLVFANKQDLPNALPSGRLAELLRLDELEQSSHVQPCCYNREGELHEGLDWLLEEAALT